MADQEETYRFAKLSKDDKRAGVVNGADEERLCCLAVCVASQQAAGFKNYLDLRQSDCPDCGAPGFNSGWGVWLFACGAEIHSDGTPSEPCQSNARDSSNG